MLLDLTELKEKYNLQITGVIHVGASQDEEMKAYVENGIDRVVWIEADKQAFVRLLENLAPYRKMPNLHCCEILACVSDNDDDEVDFHITDNAGRS